MDAAAANVGLGLYSAQRPVAKVARSVLKMSLGTPLCAALPKISVKVDAASDLMRFIREQCDIPVSQLNSLAVLFSCRAVERQRLILLVCDEDMAPGQVIKAGLHPVAGALIDREADVMSQLPLNIIGASRLISRLTTATLSAFSMPYYSGETPTTDTGIPGILTSWLHYGSLEAIENLNPWQELMQTCGDSKDFKILHDLVAAQPIRAAIQHGDFTPWNIRVDSRGEWKVFDWERGTLKGIPGWDWFHFIIQKEILVRRCSPDDAADRMEILLESERFNDYAERAGISHLSRPLLLGYLLRQQWVIKPEDGAATTIALYEALAKRWRLADGLPCPVPSAKPVRTGEWRPITETPGSLSGEAAHILGFSKDGIMQKILNCLPSPWLQIYVDTVRWLRVKREEVSAPRHSFLQQFSSNWLTIVLSWTLVAGAAMLHHFANPHLVFIPFYLVPCGMLTLSINRRWGLLAALASALAGPMVQKLGDADYSSVGVLLWNAGMRFLLYATFICLLDRVRVEVSAARRNLGKV
jgi:hypothetical protein